MYIGMRKCIEYERLSLHEVLTKRQLLFPNKEKILIKNVQTNHVNTEMVENKGTAIKTESFIKHQALTLKEKFLTLFDSSATPSMEYEDYALNFSNLEKYGVGSESTVFCNKDKTFIIKKYINTIEESQIKSEMTTLNRYYGKNFSEIFCMNNKFYLKMKLIKGKTLKHLKEINQVPSNVEFLLRELQTKMNKLNIVHGDLHAGNIIFNGKELCPIDISNPAMEYSFFQFYFSSRYEDDYDTLIQEMTKN